MKTIIKSTLVLFALVAIQSASAQDKAAPAPKPTPAPASAPAKHPTMSSWVELKAFHQVMAQTFHPSEEGNLKPIRERSGELNEKAIALEKSKIPVEFNTPEVVAATKELSRNTAELNDLVGNKGSDEQVTALLSKTHDCFHKIIGLCNPNDEDHGQEEHRK